MKFDNEKFRRYPNVLIKKLNETYGIKKTEFFISFLAKGRVLKYNV